MVTQSNILAREIPWMQELGRLQSMGFQKVKHDLATKEQQEGKEEEERSMEKSEV